MSEEKKLADVREWSNLYRVMDLDREHFGIFDLSKWSEVGEKMTQRQYKYLLYLIFNNKYFEAKKMLVQLGLKEKPQL